MTDIEMTKLCAEAMGYRQDTDGGFSRLQQGAGMDELGWFEFIYAPLHNDAQAMALVKRFGLSLNQQSDGWTAQWFGPNDDELEVAAPDLNRAIVECVARMQAQRDSSK